MNIYSDLTHTISILTETAGLLIINSFFLFYESRKHPSMEN